MFSDSTFTFSDSCGTKVTSAGISVTDCTTDGPSGVSPFLLSSSSVASVPLSVSTMRRQSKLSPQAMLLFVPGTSVQNYNVGGILPKGWNRNQKQCLM